jgi:sigma-E factor negative regulatory protein RseA
MSEQLKESLSAVMDDEADAFELRRVLDEASGDEMLRAHWHRLHLMRDIMRGESAVYLPGLRREVFDALNETQAQQDAEAEGLHLVADAPQPRRTSWLGRLTGTAVAAGVAVLIVLNSDLFSQEQDVVFTANAQLPAVEALAPAMYSQATAADRARMDGLVVRYYQARGMHVPGVGFVKMATFKKGQAAVVQPADRGENTAQ